MTTVETVVARARGLVTGSLQHPVTMLSDDWSGGSTITFSPERKIGPGQQLCIGLTTFTVLEASAGSATVTPGLDGSTVENYSAGSVLHIRPLHTTWQIFQGLVDAVAELSSPSSGLFRVASETFSVDQEWGTYQLVERPGRILRVRNRAIASDDRWIDVPWNYSADTGIVTVDAVVDRTELVVEYTLPFTAPSSLSDTLASLGFTDSQAGLLAVGAARDLPLATEAQRAQPFSQGDPRRADEVPITANAMVHDRLRARFRDLVADERARLVQQYPYVFRYPYVRGGSL